jgi:hypothetical protein
MASSSVTVIHTEEWMDEIVWSHRSMHTDDDFEGSYQRMDYSDFREEIAIAAEQTKKEATQSMEAFLKTVQAARTENKGSAAQRPSMNDIARSRSTWSCTGAVSEEEMSTLIGVDIFAGADPVMLEDRVDAKSGDRTVPSVSDARQFPVTSLTS